MSKHDPIGARAVDGLSSTSSPFDVRVAYFLLLGRAPESEEIVAERVGEPLEAMLRSFMSSEEFLQVGHLAAHSGSLPHFSMPENIVHLVAGWFTNLTGTHVEPNWWLLLALLFQFDCFQGVLSNEDAAPFRGVVESMAHADIRRHDALRSILALDEDWFAARYPKAVSAIKAGLCRNIDEYILRYSLPSGEQILPAFSEGLLEAYKAAEGSSEITCSDLIKSTVVGARSGRVTHWLYSDFYYANFLAWQRGEPSDTIDDRRPDADGYLQFLADGDRKQESPHPLFCYAAYDTLNERETGAARPAFYDFISRGCFQEAETSAVFNNEFYLISNAEARHAVLTGSHICAVHHFLTAGVFSDRPFSPDFDIEYYRARYPDVAEDVRTGRFPSLSWHFVFFGLVEGRQPNPYFNPQYYLDSQPDVQNEMKELGIRSALEHFLLLGRERGYKAERPLIDRRTPLDDAKSVFQRRCRRNFNNVLRNGLDFGSLNLVESDVALSVVVPICNEAEFTANFLKSAFFSAKHFEGVTGFRCEVVIVDNGSTDLTSALLNKCPGIRNVAFDQPIGFPRAVNAGVSESSGAIVIVSNNDIEFAPDVFLHAYRRLQGESDIGIVGGLTILPDETLQEAGSFLDRSASVVGLGRFENPWDGYFQGVHEADYCTGSFLAFRREDYDALGGLEEAFSPGYYEETDFTFRMRENLGKKAVVDSEIQVIHFEHASFGKGRPPTATHARIRKNQNLFASRHRVALAERPVHSALASPCGARPNVIGRTRFLIIEDFVPDSRLGSGFVRSAQILEELTRSGIGFDLLVLRPNPVVNDFVDPRVTVFRAWMPGESAEAILANNAARYSHIMICRTHNLARFGGMIEDLRHRHGFEVICDTEALSILRPLEIQALAGQYVSDEAKSDAIRLDLASPLVISRWIAVTPHEQKQIATAGLEPVSVIGHRFEDHTAEQGLSWADRRRILAVGAVHDAGAPNHDGMIWFLKSILPRCRDLFAEYRLTIVGHWADHLRKDLVAQFGDLPVEFLGVVSDDRIRELYRESVMAIAPTRFAAGVACKVLESMAHGVPIVMTDLLEAQLAGDDGLPPAGLAVGRRDDGGRSFASWLSSLAADRHLWDAVLAAQHGVFQRFASAGTFAEQISAFLHDIGAKTGR